MSTPLLTPWQSQPLHLPTMGLDEIAAGHQLQSLHNTTIAWLGSANLFPIPWHESASHISLSNKLLFQGKNPEVKDKIIMNCGRIVSLSLVLFCNILLSRSFASRSAFCNGKILQSKDLWTSSWSITGWTPCPTCHFYKTKKDQQRVWSAAPTTTDFIISPNLRCCNRSICLVWRPQVLNDQRMLEEVEKSTSSTTMGFPHLKVLIFCGGSSLISFFTLTSSRFTWEQQSTTGFLEFMVAAMFFFPRAFDSSLTSGFEGKSFEGNTCHLKRCPLRVLP